MPLTGTQLPRPSPALLRRDPARGAGFLVVVAATRSVLIRRCGRLIVRGPPHVTAERTCQRPARGDQRTATTGPTTAVGQTGPRPRWSLEVETMKIGWRDGTATLLVAVFIGAIAAAWVLAELVHTGLERPRSGHLAHR